MVVLAQPTDTLVNVLGKKPQHIHIVIEEIDVDNWGYEGILTCDWRRTQD